MKRIAGICAAACLIAACWSGVALAWGSAAHAWVGDRIGRTGMLINSQELYGAMAPDVFNFSFDNPAWMGYLYPKTHTDFLGIWERAKSPAGKALGYGFASHNGVWGADLTAHTDGRTVGEGYVVAKARDLITQLPFLADLGLSYAAQLEICHTMVGYGIDVLVKRLDPQIGYKVAAAAIFRSPEFAALLNREYAGDLAATFGISKREATDFIIGTESNFRHLTMQYGIALTRDEATVVQTFAEQLASLAPAFLAMYHEELPPGDLTPLAAFGIQQAMALCASDFAAELEATAQFTAEQLALQGVAD